MKRLLLLGGMLGFLQLPQAVAADEPTLVVTTSRFEQEENRLPSHITIISRQEIERLAATDLSQLLRRVPGLQVSQTNGKTSVSMRGISAEQAGSNLLIQVDGQRLNHTDLAFPDLDTVNLIDIERIEIIQGAASSLYGDQAVAGVINIITRSGKKQSNRVRYSGGRFDYRQAAANLSYAINSRWSVGFKANKTKTDNYREHNQLDREQAGVELNYRDSQQQWYLSYRTRDETLHTPGALLSDDLANPRQSRPEFANDYVRTDDYYGRLFGQIALNSTWKLALDINHQEADIDSVNSFIGFATTTVNQTNRQQTSVYPRLQGEWRLEQGTVRWIAGLDYDEANYSFSLLQRSNQQQMESLYSQLYWPLSTATTLELAGRLADVEDRLVDANLYPNGALLTNSASAYDLGLSHQFAAATSGFVRYSNNYRFAKVDEQAYTSANVLGLEPQQGRSLELGINSQFANSSLQLSAYQLTLTDEIIFDPSATPPEGAFFPGANVNGAKSERLGLLLDYRLLIDSDELGLSYHWVDAKTKEQRKTIPGVSRHTATLWYDWQLTADLSWYLEAFYRSKRFQDGDRDNFFTQVDGYGLLNTALYWQLKDARVGIRFDNILDKAYIDYAQFNGFYPAKGRDIRLTIDLVF